MKHKDIVIVFSLAIILLLVWIIIEEKQRNSLKDKIIRRLTDENNLIRNAYLDLLQQHLLLHEETPSEIIKDLESLKTKVIDLSRETHIELGSVIDNVRNGKGVKAVRELGKIIEHSLKLKVNQDQQFKKKPTLCNLLEHAKNCNLIKPNEHAYAELIREIRNKESHELNVEEKPHRIGLAIYAGIEIMYAIHNLN
jgi:hypothetical protein